MAFAVLMPLSLMLVICVGPEIVIGTFYPAQPFIDPLCQRGDCSWQYIDPIKANSSTQSCTILDYSDNGNIDGVCRNPIPVPDDVQDRPGPAENVVLEEFSKHFDVNVTGDADTAGDYTCLRIKYTLNEFFAEKIKGIQFTLRPMNSADLSLYFCQNHNHGEGIDYYAVQDYVNQNYVVREFTYECFCGIKPGNRYDVIVRTLPVDYSIPDDPNDTGVLKQYPDDCVNPKGCDQKKDDKRCEYSPAARWRPKCQESQQILADNYRKVRVSFDRAPPVLSFNKYKVLLYYFNKTTWQVTGYTDQGIVLTGTKDLKVNKTDYGSFSVSPGSCAPDSLYTITTTLNLPIMNYQKYQTMCFVSTVQAYPTEKLCKDADGRELYGGCPAYKSHPFCVIANPCSTSDPNKSQCGDNGMCTPYGTEYNCTCDEGYIFMDGTCIIDQCYSKPCTEATSVCEMYYNPDYNLNNNMDHRCNCKEGFLQKPDDLKNCVVDPCFNNPCVTGRCEYHGTKDRQGFGYTCSCNEGYDILEIGKGEVTCAANPCYSNPCGSEFRNVCEKSSTFVDLGNSKQWSYTHSCQCAEEFLALNNSKACLANPCIQSNPNQSPCGGSVVGKCTPVVSTDQQSITYNCTCKDGYHEDIDKKGVKTCKPDPCVDNPCVHGICERYRLDDNKGFDYTCSCNEEFEVVVRQGEPTCESEVGLGKIIAAVAGSVGGALLFIITGICLIWRRIRTYKKNRPCDREDTENDGLFIIQHSLGAHARPPSDEHTGIPTDWVPEPEPTDEPPRVFILYSDDHEKHRECVRNFANFLHNSCHCKVRLDMWETTTIGDTRVWVYDQICNADKVIIIFSKGTWEKWQSLMKSMAADISDLFLRGYTYAREEFEKDRSLLSNKYIAACFEYWPKQNIPLEMRNTIVFEIPNQLEQLYLRIHNIPPASPGSRKRVKDLQPDAYHLTPYGAALHQVIEEMKDLIEKNPHWYQFRRMNSEGYHSGDSPVESNSALDRAFFDLGHVSRSRLSLNDDNFTDIFQMVSEEPLDSGLDVQYRQAPPPGEIKDDFEKSYEAEFDCEMEKVLNESSICPSDTESTSSLDHSMEKQPLTTLDPSDVQLHSQPPTELVRMDSGVEFSDLHLASNPGVTTPFIRNDSVDTQV